MAQAKKRKKFFEIEIPILKKQTQVYGYGLKEFNKKRITYDLTKVLRGKNALMKLIVDVKDDSATSKPIEIKILPCFIRRMVRKGTNYVEDSFSVECLDSFLRLKPFLITRKKVSRKVRKALRDFAKENLTKYVEKQKTEKIFEEIINNKIQKELSIKLKKIYPLSLCEIRIIKVEKFKEEIKQEK